MNKYLSKFKSFDYRAFFLAHGEKVGMGVAGTIALLCLAMTRWGGYSKTPFDMETEAKKVQDQLQSNRWPGAEREKYVVATAENETARYLSALELGAYNYQIPLSPKINIYQQPADEVEVVAALELITHAIEFPVIEEVPPEAVEEPTTKPAAGSSRAADKKPKDRSKPKSGDLDKFAAAANDAGGGAGAAAAMGAFKSRGKRAIVITGIVDRKAQLEKFRKALHQETLAKADSALTYSDFKLERKRAIPGPDPWAGEWKEVSVKSSLEHLKYVEFAEADLVPDEYLDYLFCAVLPKRPDEDWDPRYVVHPRIPTHDARAREVEEAKNAAAAEILAGEDEEGGRKRKGLLRGQKDAKRMRRKAQSLAGEGFAGAVSGFLGGGSAGLSVMPPGMTAGGGMAGSRPPGGIPGGAWGEAGASNRPTMSGRPGIAGAGLPGMMGAGVGGGMSAAPLQMLRFFDFDVEPNECYIYRVKLEIANPSHGSDFVRQASVAEGETRESEWSNPSTPSIAPKEIVYAVHKVANPPTPNRVAELDVVQFDTDVGARVESILALKYGQYISGEKEVEFPNLGQQTFKKDKVNFASQDLFLDAVPAPKLASSLMSDLGIDLRQLVALQSQMDQAVTINRFGELQAIAGGSTEELDDTRKKLKKQNEKFKNLKAGDSTSSSSGPFGFLNGGANSKDGKDGKKKHGRNSLKGGM
ncbi:MAG: hypothetical protein NT069_09250 [Planctomycetota bacterium]|nr:hypothetical protein [Planctomycetota bacterium]